MDPSSCSKIPITHNVSTRYARKIEALKEKAKTYVDRLSHQQQSDLKAAISSSDFRRFNTLTVSLDRDLKSKKGKGLLLHAINSNQKNGFHPFLKREKDSFSRRLDESINVRPNTKMLKNIRREHSDYLDSVNQETFQREYVKLLNSTTYSVEVKHALLMILRKAHSRETGMNWRGSIELSMKGVQLKYVPSDHIVHLSDMDKEKEKKFLLKELFTETPDLLMVEKMPELTRGVKRTERVFPHPPSNDLWLVDEAPAAVLEAEQRGISLFCPELSYSERITVALNGSHFGGYQKDHIFARFIFNNFLGVLSKPRLDIMACTQSWINEFNSASGWGKEYSLDDCMRVGRQIFGETFQLTSRYLSDRELTLDDMSCPLSEALNFPDNERDIDPAIGFVKGVRAVVEQIMSVRDRNIIQELRSAIESGSYKKITVQYGMSHYVFQERALLLMHEHYRKSAH